MKKSHVILATLMLVLFLTAPVSARVTRFDKAPSDYSGIGVFWLRVPRGYKIVTVFKNGPSSGKLRVGDIITEVNGLFVLSGPGSDTIRTLSSNPGITANIKVLRGNEKLLYEITSRDVFISPSKIMETAIPIGKITIFQTEQYFYSDLNTSDNVRSGDRFLVYDGDKPVGVARVREASFHRTELTMIRFYSEVHTRYKHRYRLIFYRHAPISYTP